MSQLAEFVPKSITEAVAAVSATVANGDYGGAAEMARQAIALGYIHPALYNAQAIALEREGRDEEALAFFLQARALTPRDARLLNAIGLCLTRLWLDQAVEIFDEAIRLVPAYAITHHRKGLALGLAGEWGSARGAHARAAQLDPLYAEAIASVAAIAARMGDEKTARSEAERALRLDPSNATAGVALAQVDLAHGQFADAAARLKSILPKPDLVGHGRAVVLGFLGDALDGQGKPAEAFIAYKEANDEKERLYAPRFRGRMSASTLAGELADGLENTDPQRWRSPAVAAPSTPGPRQHVFLLGFPRSGTTLLGQVLGSHGEVVTLEEREFLADFAERFLASAAGLEQLALLESNSLTVMRESYFQRIREYDLKIDDKVFIDKHPLNTIKLPLIAKLFPDAKVLLAVRDPRDVVLSCFRRHLDVDLVKFELLSLEGAARLYDRVMRLTAVCREMMPLSWFAPRYEDLVADFDGRTRAICDFLEIPWSESLRDFATTARDLDIRQASAAQLRRGLYAEGAGQWRRYERELSPVLPALQPWVEVFGY